MLRLPSGTLHPEFRAAHPLVRGASRPGSPHRRLHGCSHRHDDVLRTLRPEFARDIEQHAAAPINDGNAAPAPTQRRALRRSSTLIRLTHPAQAVTQAFTPKAVDRLRHATEQMVDDGSTELRGQRRNGV